MFNFRHARIPAQYSDDLQRIISLLLTVDHNVRPTTEVILHHPAVVIHIAQETIKHGVASSTESNKEILSDVCTKQELHKQEFCEDFSNDKARDVWLTRMHMLKQREASLRLKELAIDEKERALAKREKQLALLHKLSEEKITRADIYLRQCREVRSVTNSQQRVSTVEDDLDTTVSADPGDTSILPTSTKLQPGCIPKPASFVRVGSERHVHFDTLPRTKSRLKHLNQHNTDIPEYCVPEKEKICQYSENAEEDNYRNGVLATLSSNQQGNKDTIGITMRPLSWKEERIMWLASKRQAYHGTASIQRSNTENKENSLGIQKQRIRKSIGTSAATVSSVPESGLGSLSSFR